jgi:ribosomal protein S18 acetylase RimI-like enzyme
MSQSNLLSDTFVRRAVVDEAPIITGVLHQAFVEFEALYTSAAFGATTPTVEAVQKRWGEGPVWIAAWGDHLVGTISAVPKNEGLYIRSMAVLPAARGRGIGYLLLQKVEEFAIEQSLHRMFLSTTPFLTGAIRLYKKFGFYRTNDSPHELFGTPLFTMVKLLKPAAEVA